MIEALAAAGVLVVASASSSGELTLAQRIERVSCDAAFDPDEIAGLLTLDGAMDLEGTREVTTGFSAASARVGCASYVESSDKRLRIWLLQLSSEGRYLEPVRGWGAIQWKTEDGSVAAELDAIPDLSLDGFTDGVFPLGSEWLVTGLKWKGEWRRWAQVISLAGGPERVKDRFASGLKKRDVLLLDAPPPGTGKMRHSPLWNRWLRFDAKSGELALEDVPDAPAKHPRQVVAVWKKDRFEIRGAKWGEIRLVEECPAP